MTGGWQGGDQSGWQPQGGDQGGYGGGWQPPDPYQQPQYGPPYDPYGQYQQQQQQQQDPYGYQGYDPGFGAPPPKKSKLPIVLSLIAILAIIGGVVAIVLLNRDDSQPAANIGGSTSTTEKPASTGKLPPPTTRRPPSSGANPPPADGVRIESPIGTYVVPKDWKAQTDKRQSGLGVDFTGGAVVGEYACGGAKYWRGFAATGDVQGKDGAELDLNKAVTDFADGFSREYYNSPQIDTPAPSPTTVDGKKAAMVTAKLTVNPTKPDCEATSGEVAVLGIAVEEGGKLVGVKMLIVVNDLAGGPSTPESVPDPVAEQILETFSLK